MPPSPTLDNASRPHQDATVDVNLTITHGFLADADILLVGPQGQSVILMSDVGCGTPGGALVVASQRRGLRE